MSIIIKKKVIENTVFFFQALLIILLILVTGEFIFSAATYLMSENLDLGYAAGPILDQMVRMSNFENIYHNDLSKFPYGITNYPPVYHIINMPFVWLFGLDTWYGLSISILSTLMTAVFMGLTIKSLTHNKFAAWVCALTFFVFVPFIQALMLVRPDALALCLSWGGLFWIVQYTKKQLSFKHLVFATITLVAAAYTKQTFVILAPATSFFWLYLNGKRREAFIFVTMLGAMGLSLCAILNYVTDGGFFLHVVRANINELHFMHGFSLAIQFCIYAVGFIVMAGFLIKKTPWDSSPRWFIIFYLIGGFLTSVLAIKSTSSYQYFSELFCGFSLVSGFIFTQKNIRSVDKNFYCVLIIFQLLLMSKLNVIWKNNRTESQSKAIENYISDVEVINKIIDETDGLILADRYMWMLPLNGRRVVFQPYELTQMSRFGVWDQSDFLQSIRDRKYSIILLPKNEVVQKAWYTDEMIYEIQSNYSATKEFTRVLVYKSNKTWLLQNE